MTTTAPLPASIPAPPRTNVYVDGFNLYYGAAKNTPFKWVDLSLLCAAVLPGLNVGRIRYFTALVSGTAEDPNTRHRQETYIRALETIPNLSVHYGHYLASTVSARLARRVPGGPRFAEVLKREEKGSDVNLATYMLVDAFRADCDQLIVITNDSDLAEPIRIINKELKIPVGVFNPPYGRHSKAKQRSDWTADEASPSITLRKVSRFTREVHSEGPACHMAVSQFSATVVDAAGRTIMKPSGW